MILSKKKKRSELELSFGVHKGVDGLLQFQMLTQQKNFIKLGVTLSFEKNNLLHNPLNMALIKTSFISTLSFRKDDTLSIKFIDNKPYVIDSMELIKTDKTLEAKLEEIVYQYSKMTTKTYPNYTEAEISSFIRLCIEEFRLLTPGMSKVTYLKEKLADFPDHYILISVLESIFGV